MESDSKQQLKERLTAVAQWGLPLVLVALAYRASWGHGFVSDATFLIADNHQLESWGQLWANLTHDYFWSSAGTSIPYWRPVTKAGWLVLACLFGKSTVAFHAYLLAWFGLGVVGVAALARELGTGRWWSCLAATLFALHPIAIEPASLVMATSDVVCASAGTWAIVAGLRWLRGAHASWGLAHVLALALALGSKEAGVLFAPLLTLWALVEWKRGDEKALPVARLARLAPAWGLTLLYLALRGALLDDGRSMPLALDPLRIFSGLGAYFWALIPFRIDSGLRSLSFAEAAAPAALIKATLVWIGVCALGAACLYRRATGPLLLLAWCVVSCGLVLLPANLNVPGAEGKYALALRWAVQAAAASSILVAMGFERFSSSERPWTARAVVTATSLWVVMSLISADATHAPYRSDFALAALEERAYQDTPESFRSAQDLCRHHDRVAIRLMAARRLREALSATEDQPDHCPWSRERRFNRLSLLVALGENSRAEALLSELLVPSEDDRRSDGQLYLLGTRLMLDKGDLVAARSMLGEARAHGVEDEYATLLEGELAKRWSERSGSSKQAAAGR